MDKERQEIDALIHQIALRAKSMQHPDSITTIEEDIYCLYTQGNVDLNSLLNSSPQAFIHDIWGVRFLIDRATGKIADCFMLYCHVRKDVCLSK